MVGEQQQQQRPHYLYRIFRLFRYSLTMYIYVMYIAENRLFEDMLTILRAMVNVGVADDEQTRVRDAFVFWMSIRMIYIQ